MKKLLLLMLVASCASGCGERPQPLTIDNSLTAEEIKAGVFTPEVMWKMGRIGSAVLSPDGNALAYTVTYYNMEENRGVTAVYVRDMVSGGSSQLTDFASNNADPKWSADGSRLYFLSDRSGSNQIWSMAADGSDVKQVSAFDRDVEGYGISPLGDKLFYVSRVPVCDRKSSDVYKDMPKSQARIYDDLMCRHWNYWDEGSYPPRVRRRPEGWQGFRRRRHHRRRCGLGRTSRSVLRHGGDLVEPRRQVCGIYLQETDRLRVCRFD